AGDGAEEPGGLPVLLDAAAGADGSGAALDGGGVDANLFDPADGEGDAAVGDQFAAVERDRKLRPLMMRNLQRFSLRILSFLDGCFRLYSHSPLPTKNSSAHPVPAALICPKTKCIPAGVWGSV